jgi:tRNA(fMet)-specific endonuclease VapC
MKIRYLLDTDMFIDIRNHRPPQVLKRFGLLEPGTIGISVITYGELIRGAERSEHKKLNYEKLKQFVELIPVQTMSEDTAIHYGKIRTALEKAGKVIGNNDLWIAAHARAMSVILITNNTKEFSRVDDLTLENWV